MMLKRSLLRIAFPVVCICALLATGAQSQQEVEFDSVSQCMFQKSTETDQALFKKFLAVMLSDNPESLQGISVMLTASMVKLATRDCDLPLETVGNPDFKLIAQKYGILMGEKIYAEAMAKLN